MDIIKKIDLAEENLQRKLEWIGRNDSRSAFTTGILIAMLGVLANASISVTIWHWYLYGIFGMTAFLLFVSLILIYFSQYPKTDSVNSSLIYFGTIAIFKCDEFKSKFKNLSNEDYLDDLLEQVHINSVILSKKFSNLKAALILLAISIIPWLMAIYFSGIYIR